MTFSSATGLTGANLSSLTGLFSYTGLNPQLNAGGPSSLTGSGYFGAKAIVPTTSTPPCAPPAGSSASSNKGPATYSGYDAAVYAAATSYLQSKTQGAEKQWLSKAANSAASGKPGFPAKKPYNSGRTGTGQLYYCELCKISCAGPQVVLFCCYTQVRASQLFLPFFSDIPRTPGGAKAQKEGRGEESWRVTGGLTAQ